MTEEYTVDIELLCGVLNEDGSIEKSCTIKAMTGGLRKKISQPEYRKNGIKVIDAVLDACIISIGKNPFVASREKKRMLMADSDFLMMKIRQLSLGNEVSMQLQCPSCDTKWNAELHIDEIECFSIPEDNVEIIDGRRAFKIDTEHWKKCVMFYPNREDQAIIAKIAMNNPTQAAYSLYGRMLHLRDNKEVDDSEFMKEIDKMPLMIIDELTNEINGILPGVESTHEAECPGCSNTVEMEMGGADFLFKRPETGNKKRLKIG